MAPHFVVFWMSLADFNWLAEELCNDLAQDPIGRGQPLSVEAQAYANWLMGGPPL
ncbi:hypothetical protein VP01_414g5 [Puccinia sorghi]|uniref:Uncharacterized protein n=1 Tax=Puccinia sorghi TaxID=27349 RepID=A0A0L6USZ1_9BASI|nr:hypothetical protein VP01_414g5 [Puccinia sorghi]